MQNLAPIPRAERDLDLSFTPVPRVHDRHDGWTVERQKAFIEALADTGSIRSACRMVNMSNHGAYYLRRQPGAESFRRAWEAALDFGVQRLKDEAFDRAMTGELVPLFVGGKLMGFRRKKNDRLLMFCLRHYGQDGSGRRVTVNYFSNKAVAGAASQVPPRDGGEERSSSGGRASTGGRSLGDHAQHGGGGAETSTLAAAEASTTTIQVTGAGDASAPAARLEHGDALAAALNAFEGVALDDEAQAGILTVLNACAERRRALDPDAHRALPDRYAAQAEDEECDFIPTPGDGIEYIGELETGVDVEDYVPFREGEDPWEALGQPVPQWFIEWEQRQAEAAAALPCPTPEPTPEDQPPLPAPDPGQEPDATPISPRTGKPLKRYRKRTPKSRP